MVTAHEPAALKLENLEFGTLEWLADFEYPSKAILAAPRHAEIPEERPIRTLSIEDAEWLAAQEFPILPELQRSGRNRRRTTKHKRVRPSYRIRLLLRWRRGLTLSSTQNLLKPFGFEPLPPVSCVFRTD